MISNPTRYCFKIWKAKGSILRADPKQAREACSVNTIPYHDFDPENKTNILMLPGKKPGKATVISRHTSPRIPDWITQINNFLRPYLSYHTFTDGSYKKLP